MEERGGGLLKLIGLFKIYAFGTVGWTIVNGAI